MHEIVVFGAGGHAKVVIDAIESSGKYKITGLVAGEGSVIFGGAVANPDTKIGRHYIVNTSASLDHDNVLEDFASIAPKAATSGNVQVGAFSAVCIGANISHDTKIESHIVIGAGTIVITDNGGLV